MRWVLRIGLPLAILAVGILGAGALGRLREAPQRVPPAVEPPLVEVVTVRSGPHRLRVQSHGTAAPARESALVAEVPGRVLSVSPNLVAGGFFEEGEALLTIEPRDFEAALAAARSSVARAELRVAEIAAEAAVARSEWGEVGEGEAADLTLRRPHLAEAQAALDAARAAEAVARLDLARTRVRAPFAGRVRAKHVDLGHYVTPGTPLARLDAIDAAEVRLPLSTADLAHVELPLGWRSAAAGGGPEVVLRADFAGEEARWSGRVVRTEGAIDRATRSVVAVARVEDPYGVDESLAGPPLLPGLFVRAEILGRRLEAVVPLPRAALREDDRVYVAVGGRLEVREVEVVRTDSDTALVRRGVADGESVVVSNLQVAVDGMRIRSEERAAGTP